jgi:hypothetical protein
MIFPLVKSLWLLSLLMIGVVLVVALQVAAEDTPVATVAAAAEVDITGTIIEIVVTKNIVDT